MPRGLIDPNGEPSDFSGETSRDEIDVSVGSGVGRCGGGLQLRLSVLASRSCLCDAGPFGLCTHGQLRRPLRRDLHRQRRAHPASGHRNAHSDPRTVVRSRRSVPTSNQSRRRSLAPQVRAATRWACRVRLRRFFDRSESTSPLLASEGGVNCPSHGLFSLILRQARTSLRYLGAPPRINREALVPPRGVPSRFTCQTNELKIFDILIINLNTSAFARSSPCVLRLSVVRLP